MEHVTHFAIGVFCAVSYLGLGIGTGMLACLVEGYGKVSKFSDGDEMYWIYAWPFWTLLMLILIPLFTLFDKLEEKEIPNINVSEKIDQLLIRK